MYLSHCAHLLHSSLGQPALPREHPASLQARIMSARSVLAPACLLAPGLLCGANGTARFTRWSVIFSMSADRMLCPLCISYPEQTTPFPSRTSCPASSEARSRASGTSWRRGMDQRKEARRRKDGWQVGPMQSPAQVSFTSDLAAVSARVCRGWDGSIQQGEVAASAGLVSLLPPKTWGARGMPGVSLQLWVGIGGCPALPSAALSLPARSCVRREEGWC